MKRKVMLIIGLTFLLVGCSRQDKAVKEPQIAMDMTEKEEITCQLTKKNELVISGTGAVTEQEIEAFWDEQGKACTKIKRIIIKEGITEIGDGAFFRNGWIKSVQLPQSLKVIKESAFVDCCELEEINIPNNVEKIEKDAIGCCCSLKKIELPTSLKEYHKEAIAYCSSLQEIVNHSSYDWKLSKNNMLKGTWLCDGKEVNNIPAGKTIKIVPETYAIEYDLNGGEITGELPNTYQHTEGCKLPRTVKREGYEFLLWHPKDGSGLKKVEVGTREDLQLQAWWIKLDLENAGKGKIRATCELQGDGYEEFMGYFIRISESKDMRKCKLVHADMGKRDKVISKLQSGKRYYVQGSSYFYVDGEWEMEDCNWTKPKSIVVE